MPAIHRLEAEGQLGTQACIVVPRTFTLMTDVAIHYVAVISGSYRKSQSGPG